VEKTEKVRVSPLPANEETVRSVQPVNGLELKGPIEVDPSSASDLNQKETFEVDGPGATKGGEVSETAKPEPVKPKISPAPESTPDGKLSSPSSMAPSSPPHSKFVPAHVNPAPHKDALTQFVPGDKVAHPRVAPAPHVAPPAPKALAQKVPVVQEEQKETKPAKKSYFQRMRSYFKENFQ
ncbi:MAG: hypothetical protein C0469_11185, partial [Cyanobacteria bacterium DS2.3.42]|nr:hypothetical protein [Cyanobacteria bacterium DS2.3.42]